MNARAIAAKFLYQVIVEKRSLGMVLTQIKDSSDNKKDGNKDHALIQELCYGVLRYYPRLQALLKLLLKKPIKKKEALIELLILTGFYQLEMMRIPDHAVVMETVTAVRELKKDWAANLVNGVLRNFLRNKESLLKKLAQDPQAHFAHPQWLIDKIKRAWPNQWQQILTANNQHPAMSLRVNCQKLNRDAYLQKLQQNNLAAFPSPYNNCGITLEHPVDVAILPGFADGEVSVQDLAAQLASNLLELQPGLRVLDACAAPGGKAIHILETEPQLELLIALEKETERAKKITENLQRSGLNAKLKISVGDATQPQAWWDNQLFDRILLDAPCSATGVIRRHPDIKILRTEGDIANTAALQLQILQALWPLLKPGGLLVYATCSIMPEENSLNIERFLKKQNDARDKVISADWGVQQSHGRQIFPGKLEVEHGNEMDGFYYCCLQKICYRGAAGPI